MENKGCYNCKNSSMFRCTIKENFEKSNHWWEKNQETTGDNISSMDCFEEDGIGKLLKDGKELLQYLNKDEKM